MALNRGSELFEVGVDGPRVLARRDATPAEDAALTRAAELTVARLTERGLETCIVSQRLNRRKIDLIPLPEWTDPPKAQIDRLLAAVEQRLHAAGIESLAEVAALSTDIAHAAGLADPHVTSDAKHVEIGLTDKSDSSHAVLDEFWTDGIAPESVLIGGDEFGGIGGLPGSDSFMMISEAVGGRSVLRGDRAQWRARGCRAPRGRSEPVPAAAQRSATSPPRSAACRRANGLVAHRRPLRSRGRPRERGVAHDRRRHDRHQRGTSLGPSRGAPRGARGRRLRW